MHVALKDSLGLLCPSTQSKKCLTHLELLREGPQLPPSKKKAVGQYSMHTQLFFAH